MSIIGTTNLALKCSVVMVLRAMATLRATVSSCPHCFKDVFRAPDLEVRIVQPGGPQAGRGEKPIIPDASRQGDTDAQILLRTGSRVARQCPKIALIDLPGELPATDHVAGRALRETSISSSRAG